VIARGLVCSVAAVIKLLRREWRSAGPERWAAAAEASGYCERWSSRAHEPDGRSRIGPSPAFFFSGVLIIAVLGGAAWRRPALRNDQAA